MKGKWYIWILLFVLFTSCEHGAHESLQKVGLPISISLPMDELQMRSGAPVRRVIGDPGTTETFVLPNYIYFIIMRKNAGGNWSLWKIEKDTLEEEDWTRTRYTGRLSTPGDSIFQYNGKYEMLIDDPFEGRVYGIASAVPLTFNMDLNAISDLEDVLNLSFNTAAANVQPNLQHIYATPYNYEVDGDYYGAFNSFAQKVPYVRLMLYHVAAKVDIKWNVEKSVRLTPPPGIRLTRMEARNLFNDYAYCFRPMRNEKAAVLTTGFTVPNIVTASDEGLWWEGRAYFYTIPYTVTGDEHYFPLQMSMETNANGNDYRPTLKLEIDTSSVFVPWLRANFNIAKVLENTTETKVVDN